MTVPSWPAEMPYPQRTSYRSQRFDARRKTTFDAGPPGRSRRFSAVGRTIALTFRLTALRAAVFERFYVDTCAEGSLPFWMPDYMVDGIPLLTETGAQLLDENGVPLLCSKIMLVAWGDETPTQSNVKLLERDVSFEVIELP